MGIKKDMDKKELRRMFDAADEDGSGSIDRSELKRLLKKKGVFPGEAYYGAVFKSIDTDGSGEIDFDEFMSGMGLIQCKKNMSERELKDIKNLFEQADADNSGNVNEKEMKKILKKLKYYPGDREFETLFKEIDIDGSGEIELDEFILGINKLQTCKKGGFSKSSGSEMNELRTLFEEADEDGSGNIDKSEMKKALKRMGIYPGDKDFDAKFRKVIDTDGSGEVDFDEFVYGVKYLQEEEELRRKFKKLDSDGSGKLDFNDLKLGFKAMNYPIADGAIHDMIKVASSDGDDEVSFEEFCEVARKIR